MPPLFPGFDAFAADVPPAQWLGLRLRDEGETTVSVEMTPRAEHLQVAERVHGGVLATLADTAAAWVVVRGLEDGTTTTSTEFGLHFLRPALGTGEPLVARATLVKRGRRVAVVDVEVAQGGALVAKGLFSYLIFAGSSD